MVLLYSEEWRNVTQRRRVAGWQQQSFSKLCETRKKLVRCHSSQSIYPIQCSEYIQFTLKRSTHSFFSNFNWNTIKSDAIEICTSPISGLSEFCDCFYNKGRKLIKICIPILICGVRGSFRWMLKLSEQLPSSRSIIKIGASVFGLWHSGARTTK